VVVCDGFVGNVALKASEGLAQMLAGFVREEFTRNALARLIALIAAGLCWDVFAIAWTTDPTMAPACWDCAVS